MMKMLWRGETPENLHIRLLPLVTHTCPTRSEAPQLELAEERKNWYASLLHMDLGLHKFTPRVSRGRDRR